MDFSDESGFAAVRAFVISAAIAGAAAGCTSSSHPGAILVDPAKYDLYDCRQLEEEARALQAREGELRTLIARARGGAAGSAVAELAYGPDYATVTKKIDDVATARRQRGCAEVTVPASRSIR